MCFAPRSAGGCSGTPLRPPSQSTAGRHAATRKIQIEDCSEKMRRGRRSRADIHIAGIVGDIPAEKRAEFWNGGFGTYAPKNTGGI